MRPTQWPAECQLSLGAPALESQYSLKLGCPWCIRSWWLHPSRTFYLILLFLSRTAPLFFSHFAQASCMNLVSNENNIEKWNQGGVLGRSPAGCPLGIFYFTLSLILSTIILGGKGGGGFDYKSFFLRGDIYTDKTFWYFRLFFLRKDASLSFWINKRWKHYVFPFVGC